MEEQLSAKTADLVSVRANFNLPLPPQKLWLAAPDDFKPAAISKRNCNPSVHPSKTNSSRCWIAKSNQNSHWSLVIRHWSFV